MPIENIAQAIDLRVLYFQFQTVVDFLLYLLIFSLVFKKAFIQTFRQLKRGGVKGFMQHLGHNDQEALLHVDNLLALALGLVATVGLVLIRGWTLEWVFTSEAFPGIIGVIIGLMGYLALNHFFKDWSPILKFGIAFFLAALLFGVLNSKTPGLRGALGTPIIGLVLIGFLVYFINSRGGVSADVATGHARETSRGLEKQLKAENKTRRNATSAVNDYSKALAAQQQSLGNLYGALEEFQSLPPEKKKEGLKGLASLAGDAGTKTKTAGSKAKKVADTTSGIISEKSNAQYTKLINDFAQMKHNFELSRSNFEGDPEKLAELNENILTIDEEIETLQSTMANAQQEQSHIVEAMNPITGQFNQNAAESTQAEKFFEGIAGGFAEASKQEDPSAILEKIIPAAMQGIEQVAGSIPALDELKTMDHLIAASAEPQNRRNLANQHASQVIEDADAWMAKAKKELGMAEAESKKEVEKATSPIAKPPARPTPRKKSVVGTDVTQIIESLRMLQTEAEFIESGNLEITQDIYERIMGEEDAGGRIDELWSIIQQQLEPIRQGPARNLVGEIENIINSLQPFRTAVGVVKQGLKETFENWGKGVLSVDGTQNDFRRTQKKFKKGNFSQLIGAAAKALATIDAQLEKMKAEEKSGGPPPAAKT